MASRGPAGAKLRAEQMSWFNFDLVAERIACAHVGGTGDGWKRFDPAFAYRYWRVAGITIREVLDLGMTYPAPGVDVWRVDAAGIPLEPDSSHAWATRQEGYEAQAAGSSAVTYAHPTRAAHALP